MLYYKKNMHCYDSYWWTTYLVHAQDTPSSMESLFRIVFKSAAYQICEAGAWLQFENVALTQKEQSTRSCLAILKLSWMPFAYIFSRRLFWHLGLSNLSMRVRGIKWKRVLSNSGASGGRSTISIITNFVIQTPLFSSYKNKHDKTIHHHCRKLLHSSTCSPFPPSPPSLPPSSSPSASWPQCHLSQSPPCYDLNKTLELKNLWLMLTNMCCQEVRDLSAPGFYLTWRRRSEVSANLESVEDCSCYLRSTSQLGTL